MNANLEAIKANADFHKAALTAINQKAKSISSKYDGLAPSPNQDGYQEWQALRREAEPHHESLRRISDNYGWWIAAR